MERIGAPASSAGALSFAYYICFNMGMASIQNIIARGRRHDLEPFWPSRQHHDFDRVCCRATHAQAL
ncbi:hypothetical protein OKJ48_04495 [Streptomyces kunmingensis]|uniref:Tn3 transposase DDE domain-containing protein n=1 Tax=Streptomyces kunmingensis TaxID=68225 RepID=A0ABU6C468_9ACTN|nr:hypothetical protein [Streptomyces kunmingensis]MEB3959516.1 hypothetical protein [Streptomyces kunmingensis]